ncbi:urease accessory protein UreD [Paenibacillus filicis]|uniref:Urease accessory protein UreD n=1 Tax=Paenibacillus gyeongsangnamensis TaxID=3388067 RepID=A0ABT4QKV8_9BACL|nr:urease accessory protein UreD [Paenibacillus filicis]MCZ8517508.1 urease accessory protein UreD [Paenibacillus filicis]
MSAGFTRDAGRGVTRLEPHYQTYPLKIAKTFDFGGQLGVYLMDASPGIIAGDRYELDFRFGEGTKVFLTNQSYTKVHPSRRVEGEELRPGGQRQRLILENGAYAEVMPEPLMLYKDAHFSSETDIGMAAGSSLFLSEIVCPGRTHRGELFQYDTYRNRMEVTYDGELIFSARQRVVPGRRRFQGLGGWDRYTHLGSLYLFTGRLTAEHGELLRERLEAWAPSSSGLWAGASLGYKHAVTVSVMGERVYQIQRVLEEAWALLRRELFELAPLAVPK